MYDIFTMNIQYFLVVPNLMNPRPCVRGEIFLGQNLSELSLSFFVVIGVNMLVANYSSSVWTRQELFWLDDVDELYHSLR